MHEIGFNRSLAVSAGIHILLLLILSFSLLSNPFEIKSEPVIVSIQSESDSIAAGIAEQIEQSGAQVKPELKERVTKADDARSLPEKAVLPPVQRSDQPLTREAVRENVKESTPAEAKQNVKKERVRPVNPDRMRSEDLNRKLDSSFEEEAKTDRERERVNDRSTDIDQALNDAGRPNVSSAQARNTGDPMSEWAWSVKPRNAVFFPDIISKIPPEYKKKGMGYSITARITFDKNGVAVKAEIIRSSGEIEIDSVFYSELKKVRVEPISENRMDQATITIPISVK